MSSWALFISLLIAIILGCNPNFVYGSSNTYGQRPILRYGEDYNDDEDATPPLAPVLRFDDKGTDGKTEPPWVSELRHNIKRVIKHKGYDRAGENIMKLIADADERVNHDKSPAARAPYILPDSYEDSLLPSQRGPKWMRNLKRSLRELMNTNKKNELNALLEPIVKKMQDDYDIDIEGVDVDPFGQIDVTYKSRKPATPSPASSNNIFPLGSGGTPPRAIGPGGLPPNIMGQGGIPPSVMGQNRIPPSVFPPSMIGRSGMPPSLMGEDDMPPDVMGRSGLPLRVGIMRQGGMPPNMMVDQGFPPPEEPPYYYGLRREMPTAGVKPPEVMPPLNYGLRKMEVN